MSTELEQFKQDTRAAMAQTMPVDEDGLKQEWQNIGDDNGINVKAFDLYNPFWRVITQLITLPWRWLQDYMIDHVVPNLYLKYASGPWLRAIAWGMNVEPKTKRKAQILITFFRTDVEDSLDVVVGSDVHSTVINGTTYKLKTLALGRFEAGDSEVDILCEAESEGADYNLGVGYYQVMPKNISGVIAVANKDGSTLLPGVDDETDEELRIRTRDKWSEQFRWHVEAVYRSIVASFDGVDSDAIWFDRSSPRAENSADILLLFDVGQPSQVFIDSINDEIQIKELMGLGDDVLVKTMPRIAQDIVCNYSLHPGLSETEQNQMDTDINDFIKAAFRDNAGVGWSVTRTQPYDVFSFGNLGFELFSQFQGKIKTLRFENDDIDSALNVPGINSLAVNKA